MGRQATKRSNITRSLLTGVSIGSIALVQVGCAPAGNQNAGAAQVQYEAQAEGSEEQLCERALQTRDYRDVETLLKAYPNGRCVPATLAAMPPETLTQVSPTALTRMSRATVNRIPPATAIYLKFPRSSGRSGSIGGGGSS